MMRIRFASIAIAALLSSAIPPAGGSNYPIVHVYQSGEPGIFANAYLIETEKSVVAIDATLSNSDSKALRMQLDAVGKPLVAVLLTHGHPDHYNGVGNLIAGASVPIYSTRGVADVIRRYDAEKEAQWKPVFKDEWPTPRTLPNRTVTDTQTLRFDGAAFTVHDLGAGESHADSIWIVSAPAKQSAFIGDVVLNGVHAYLSDGHTTQWLKNIERVRSLTHDSTILYPGHGDSGHAELLDAQRDYLNTYRQNIKALAGGNISLTESQKDDLEARMLKFRQTERLRFLIKLGADPVAAELAKQK